MTRLDDEYRKDEDAGSFGSLSRVLAIFARHNPKGMAKKHAFCAGHDTLYGPDAPDVAHEDALALSRAGWHWDEESDCWAMFT